MIIFGLGNSGTKYSKTKHNIGFWVLDLMVNKCSLKWESGYGEYVYAKNGDIIFAKPTTFMNNSGLALRDLCKHTNESEVLVVYDDIDLFLGTLRFKINGGTGGHKGIESIIYQLETEDFHRLKIGIGLEDIDMQPSEHYVLKPFPKKYINKAENIINTATEALDFYLQNKIEETMNKYNRIIKGEKDND